MTSSCRVLLVALGPGPQVVALRGHGGELPVEPLDVGPGGGERPGRPAAGHVEGDRDGHRDDRHHGDECEGHGG